MQEKTLKFLEDDLIKVICYGSFIITLTLQITTEFINVNWFEYVGGIVGRALTKNESTFLTISAIFIGIYFTVYTLLGSIKIESTFASIKKDNFIKLVKFIKYSFAGSFAYLFYTLFNSVATMLFVKAAPYFLIISGTLLLYMLLSALRLGIIVFLVYENDLKKVHELIEKDKKEKQNTQVILFKLEKYLEHFEQEERKKKAEYMRKRIEDKKKAEQEKSKDEP